MRKEGKIKNKEKRLRKREKRKRENEKKWNRMKMALLGRVS